MSYSYEGDRRATWMPGAAEGGAARADTAATKADAPPLFSRRISRSDIIYLTSQLAIMTETGITVSQALAGIAEQEENPTMRRILDDLRRSVEGGQDFSAALARYPKYFDQTYVSLVAASEATGTMGQMLDTISEYQRKEVEAKSKIRGAMAYPGVMMFVAVGVTIFLLTYVLPKFTPLFKSRGASLPKPTIIMMTVSDAILGYWYLWLIGLVLLTVGFAYARKTKPGRRVLDYLKISIPVVGPMFRKSTISRSIRTLGTMLGAGVPILQSLELAAKVSGNIYYEELWMKAHDQIATGRRLCETLSGNPLIPRVLVQMIASGEETGKLDVVLAKVSTFYEHEVDVALKSATSLIEPLMICAMGGIIGAIAMAMLLPIFSLSRQP